MCMPRRIVVRVAQVLNEKWQKELQHFERMTDEIRVSDTVSAEISLDEELGDLAFQGLEQCLVDGVRGWKAEGGDWVKEIEGVKATFSAKSRRITLTATMSDVITAAVEKKVTLAERYEGAREKSIDLGPFAWAGSDKIDGLEREMRRQLEDEMETDKTAKIEAARAKLHAEVKRDLADRWAGLTQAKRRELSRHVVDQLRASRAEVECEVNHLLAESYRRALILLARQQNGKVTKDEESGSVIDLEITL